MRAPQDRGTDGPDPASGALADVQTPFRHARPPEWTHGRLWCGRCTVCVRSDPPTAASQTLHTSPTEADLGPILRTCHRPHCRGCRRRGYGTGPLRTRGTGDKTAQAATASSVHGLGHKQPTNWGLQWKVAPQKPPLEGVKSEAAFLRRGLQRVRVWRLAAQRTVYAGWVATRGPRAGGRARPKQAGLNWRLGI